MRLINTKTLRLEEFLKAAKTPPYAILSHTWGDGEVSLQSFQNESFRSSRKGFRKIESACQEARRQRIEYLWADTCCIDKTSSADLSEAINSMFNWYKRSEVCYAFCEDVEQSSIQFPDIRGTGNASEKNFAGSRWFTRGWTLQELIAPKEVMFYNKDWIKIGEKSTSSELIRKITGIDTFILEGGPLPEVSVGRRMSWAADRQTTREEDIAYSLMGLFDINMPLLYGEGQKAFIRLQEEILRQSDDHTLFAWRSAPESTIPATTSGFLAEHPRNFRNFRSQSDTNLGNMHGGYIFHKDHIVRVWDHKAPQNPITITNKGIRITSRVVDLRAAWNPGQFMILILNCSPGGGDTERATGIYVRRQYEDRYARVRTNELADVRLNRGDEDMWRTLHGLKTGGADIRGHQFDEPWTTSLDIRRESLAPQWLEDQDVDTGAELLQRYEGAFQLCQDSFNANTIFGPYILDSVGILQAHSAWRFFRFDPDSKSGDAIFDTSPGCELALLYRTPNRLDLLVVILGVDLVTENPWINAECVDKAHLAREGANIAKILKGIQAMSRTHRRKSDETMVLLQENSVRIGVRVLPRMVEGMLMHRIQLAQSSSLKLFMDRGMLVSLFLVIYIFSIIWVLVMIFGLLMVLTYLGTLVGSW